MKPGTVTFKVSVKDEPNRETQGRAFRGPYGLLLVLHKTPPGEDSPWTWAVSEYTTGKRVASETSKKRAVELAVDMIYYVGNKAVQEILEEEEKINE